jgi:hypothetical protein
MKQTLLLSAIALLLFSACGGKKAQTESSDSTANQKEIVGSVKEQSDEAVKEEITSRIKELYDLKAQKKEGAESFACHTWKEMAAAVEKKDAKSADIGFFNDDLWTQMQDENPDHFEIRDLKFLQLDMEKGTALVDFVLWSSIQSVRQKFEFCREDGDWRVHNIIRCYEYDGNVNETNLMAAMADYLTQPDEAIAELVFLPDVNNDNVEDLSGDMDDHKKYFPRWIGENQVQENDGVWSYDMTLFYEMPLQQLFKDLPSKPLDLNEVARVIIFDLNQDGYSDALICLGNYNSDDPTYYFDAYVWNKDYEYYNYVEDFRNIPNPRMDENTSQIVGRNGHDREIWDWQGLDKIEKVEVMKDFY